MNAPEHQVSEKSLLERLKECPRIGELWVHLKTGNIYRVLGRCIVESTLEPAVIYEAWNDVLVKTAWCRPLSEWNEKFRKA